MFSLPYKVSKLFRAYGLYNVGGAVGKAGEFMFQSSFELTGYITKLVLQCMVQSMSFKALSSLRVI